MRIAMHVEEEAVASTRVLKKYAALELALMQVQVLTNAQQRLQDIMQILTTGSDDQEKLHGEVTIKL